MGVITDIIVQAKDKNRCNVYVDGEFSFGISIETAYKNHLKKGYNLTDEEKELLLFQGEYDIALAKALNYVSKTLKTKKQVITYLKGKGYADSNIYAVIDKLKEYGYIDDVEYAKKYIELNSSNQGKKLSSYKLANKGIKLQDIDVAFTNTEIDHKSNALNTFTKYMRNKENTKENILKASRYLYSRGFNYEEIESVISKYKEDELD